MATTTHDPRTTRPDPFVDQPIMSPVRDDDALGPTEDLDREPDGMPHGVLGMTAFFAVVVAMLIMFMFLTGKTVGHVAAIILALLAIPTIVSTMRKRADRSRDHLHPSR